MLPMFSVVPYFNSACFNENPSMRAVACVAGGIRERPRGNSRAAKPRVKFPPATFRMVFACHPLLSLLMIQLNKPIRERSLN